MTIAFATCRPLPEEDADEAPIASALASAGLDVRLVPWRDPAVDWSSFESVIIRSTWDYHHHVDEFLAWVDHVASQVPLWNPAPVIRWNAHKRYLLDLAGRGVPVVPTLVLPRGAAYEPQLNAAASRWPELVLKPAWSAGSYATIHTSSQDIDAARVHLSRWAQERDFLIQPYLPSVQDPGERCLVFFHDQFSHAVRKQPRFADDEEGTALVEPEADELALAAQVLAAAPGPRLYARVDMARTPDGLPCLMELELIEPSLFVRYDAAALGRWVDAVRGCSKS